MHVIGLINSIIVSITKFSIVIGSPRAYLSRNRRAITWVSDNRSYVTGYSHDLHVNYARFNGFFAMFRKVFNIYEKRSRYFRSKELP